MTYSPLAHPSAVRDVLGEFGLSAKKHLGQNFLADDNIVGRILEAAGLEAPEAPEHGTRAIPTVIEVGPGIGTLTVALLGCADVVAVERDESLGPVLQATIPRFAVDAPGRFEIVWGDALGIGADQILGAAGGQVPHMVVANLPYAIASTLVLSWLDAMPFVESMVVMVQSEVADRMCARPSTKAYGAYTVKLALRARITARFQVSPTCFVPAPHVESSVVRLERLDAPGADPPGTQGADPHDTPDADPPDASDAAIVALASEVADAAFAQRRKTLRNSLRAHFGDAATDAMLDAAHIDGSLRAEALSPEAFVELARATCGHVGS